MSGREPCPCPLCGNPDLSVRYEPFITGLSYGIVECEPCALSLREDDIEQAIGRWNTRAETPPADADATERLIAAVDAWIEDPNPDAEQEIMDARVALRGLGGAEG